MKGVILQKLQLTLIFMCVLVVTRLSPYLRNMDASMEEQILKRTKIPSLVVLYGEKNDHIYMSLICTPAETSGKIIVLGGLRFTCHPNARERMIIYLFASNSLAFSIINKK